MKKYGKILIAGGVVCGVIFAVRCVTNPERRITNFVEANYVELQEIADAHLTFDASVDTYQDVEVDGWHGQWGTDSENYGELVLL